MENWNNLNLFLSLDENFQNKKKELALRLIEACTKNNKEKVIETLRQGAYINASDEYQTPLMACVEADSLELARYLLRIGASPSKLVGDKDAAWLALYRQKYSFLAMFFENKFKQNILKEKATTLLIYATESSDLDAVEIIAYKVNVNQKDATGSTALHYNLAKKEPTPADIEIGKILLACGADTNTQNLDGLTPKDLAATESASILLEHQALEQTLDEVVPVVEPEDSLTLDFEEPTFTPEISPEVEPTAEPKKKFKI